MSIEAHTAAVIAALNAGSPNANAYTLDDLKGLSTKPAAYTEVIVSHRFGAPNRAGGSTGRGAYRIATRYVARLEVNAKRLRDRGDTALRFAHLSIGGDTTTPVQFESEDPIGDDDGWFSGLTTWTYVI